jgi:hypothetical protein
MSLEALDVGANERSDRAIRGNDARAYAVLGGKSSGGSLGSDADETTLCAPIYRVRMALGEELLQMQITIALGRRATATCRTSGGHCSDRLDA